MTSYQPWQVLLLVLVGLSFTVYLHLAGKLSFSHNHWPWVDDCEEDQSFMTGRPGYDVTVVTMYLHLGNFQKGKNIRHDTAYLAWMAAWAGLNNTVFAFFDNDLVMNHFKEIRSAQPAARTHVVKVSRDDLSAFQDLETVENIFAQPNYPKHPPNTVMADYSVTMNAKVDALEIALNNSEHRVHTKYIAWMDIGCFRSLSDAGLKRNFRLEVPDNFKDDGVSFSQVNKRSHVFQHDPWDIIKNNRVWVSGAFMVATKEVMRTYVKDYRAAVSELLGQKMASTDQQIVASLYGGYMKVKPSKPIHTYNCTYGQLKSINSYFCLAYLCLDASYQRCRAAEVVT